MKLLDLPHELLFQIISCLHEKPEMPNESPWTTPSQYVCDYPAPDKPHIPEPLQNLRLVHLALLPILNPLLFSSFTLTFNKHHIQDLATLRTRLRNLVHIDSGVSGYVQKLTLTAYLPPNDQYPHEANDQAIVAEVQAIVGEYCLDVCQGGGGSLERLELNALFLGMKKFDKLSEPWEGWDAACLEDFNAKMVPGFERLGEGGGLREVKISGRSGGRGPVDLYREFVIPRAKKIVSDSPRLRSLEIAGGVRNARTQAYLEWGDILPVLEGEGKALALETVDTRGVVITGMNIRRTLLPHLRHLTSLKLASFVKDPGLRFYRQGLHAWWAEKAAMIDLLFQGLQSEEIWLRKIHLEGIGHRLVDYLDAYPVSSQARVHELILENAEAGDVDLNNEIAVRFWSGLAKHASSLLRLEIRSPCHSKLCYCPEAALVLYQCSNLQHLAYPGNPASGESKDTLAVMLPELLRASSGLKEWVVGKRASMALRGPRSSIHDSSGRDQWVSVLRLGMSEEMSKSLGEREVKTVVWGHNIVLGATSKRRKQCEAQYRNGRRLFSVRY